MALGYIPFQDGTKMEDVRNKLNSFNDNVVLEVNNLIQEVQNLDSRINNNATNINNVSQRVTVLEEGAYYEYEKYSGITVPSDAYQVVGALARDDVPSGTYEVKFSATYTLDSTTSSAYIRFSLDGGNTWYEFRREPKDKTDREGLFYAFPVDFTGPDVHLIVEARKENAADNFELEFLDIIIDKKK
jgi:hypothetical protein